MDEEPDARITRFTHWSVELSVQPTQKALAQAGANVSDATGLLLNTGTDYICPGIATHLIEKVERGNGVCRPGGSGDMG